MKIFITGGAGFIGSHIVDSLISQKHQVTVYDNLSTGYLENISQHKDKLKFINGDILDREKLEHSIKGHDIVSHQAAQLEIMLSHDHPEKDLESNTVGSLNVILAAKKTRVKRLVVASSACVYGQPQHETQNELHPTEPNWSYGVSKLAMEKYAQIYSQTDNMDITLLRYGIVYGPREWYRRALTIFIKRVAHGKPPVVFGAGGQHRDLVYVKDIVKFHDLCLVNKKTKNQIYNLASGNKITIKKLAKKVVKVANLDIQPITENVKAGTSSSIIKGKTRNINDLKGMHLDISKAKELGWQPSTSLSSGIKKTLEWYKENQDRWQKIAGT